MSWLMSGAHWNFNAMLKWSLYAFHAVARSPVPVQWFCLCPTACATLLLLSVAWVWSQSVQNAVWAVGQCERCLFLRQDLVGARKPEELASSLDKVMRESEKQLEQIAAKDRELTVVQGRLSEEAKLSKQFALERDEVAKNLEVVMVKTEKLQKENNELKKVCQMSSLTMLAVLHICWVCISIIQAYRFNSTDLFPPSDGK